MEPPGKITASLKHRSLRAGAWVGAGHAAGQVIRLVGNLILARFLMPEAFGIMAVISTLLMALNLLSDIGTGPVIIQSGRGADRDFLNTAWTLQIIRGFVLWIIGLLLALGIAFGQSMAWFTPGTVYADPRLPVLIAVAVFATIIHGFASMKIKLAERNLDLRSTALLDLSSAPIGVLVMVIGAVLTESVWALVIGSLVGALMRSVLSHLMLKGPSPALRLESEALRELLGKGKWVMLSTLLGFVAINSDRVLLGGLADSTTFGLYSIALALGSIGPAVVAMLLMRVVLPAISEVVRERRSELVRTYRHFQRLVDVCLGLMAGTMFMASDAIIQLLYDARYHAAGHIFAVLAIGSIGARFFVVDLVSTAMGRNSLVAASMVPRVVILLAGLPIGYSLYQLDGALAAIVCSQFVQWPIAIWVRMKHGLNSLRNDVLLPIALVAGGCIGWLLDRALRMLSA